METQSTLASIYEPNNPLGDVVGKYKAALENAGVQFGMYMGNLIFDNHGGNNGGILMVEDAMRRYHPRALWFDWASLEVYGYQSLDALYSMIKTIQPGYGDSHKRRDHALPWRLGCGVSGRLGSVGQAYMGSLALRDCLAEKDHYGILEACVLIRSFHTPRTSSRTGRNT